ncbi:DUF3373 family protein [Photobacterium lipolyticum]|uniref:DUF3373 domain-containing protein n=1 Tax=Photobacterium lipolyticum TaxID=266810 RepID=A0A2T3N4K1_9GAMM|nr:DUF3373 family protein [Photobacterium lipolyticum]PSW07411.1 DUF3373 domain-containing protein [Photobacterium lipolyticum]
MNRLTPIATALILALSAPVLADQAEDIEMLKEQVRELQKKAGGHNLKFSADYRVTADAIEYKMADGSTAKNDGLFANRLEIGMGYQYNENLIFKGLLSYNKAFGESMDRDDYGDFDWVVNENLDDNSLNVKEVYMLYLGDQFLGNNQIPWSFSIGRRPSTNGFLANHREGYDEEKSPLAHSINVEFDGFSLATKLDKITGVDGMAAKICAGRGVSATAAPRFSMPNPEDGSYTPDYAEVPGGLDNTDMIGLIFTPYDDGQYHIKTQYYYANNMIDINQATGQFEDLGNLQNLTLSMEINGIGEFINDFLDDTVLFASVAASQTMPKDNQPMLGSLDDETGYSYWVGAKIPGFFANDSFGFEYNHGSKYWRSFTYGEDTLVGSKIAARGDAFEAYYTIPIIDESLYFQLRYTYIDYDYTGSNGFFGDSGAPMLINDAKNSPFAGMVVESAQDVRAMIRYTY